MTKVDDSEILAGEAFEDADFVRYEFGDFDKATAAERFFPTSFSHTGTAIEIRVAHVAGKADEIAANLASAGLAYTLEVSSLTEEEMWPDEPGDEEDEIEQEVAPPSPRP